MKVSTKEAAWKKANELFPTDYALDCVRSDNAGYGIYFSTAHGVNAWISDLGDRLEVNLPDGSSVNIWVEPEVFIRETKMWDADSVRNCCIRHQLYTCGSMQEYNIMLNMIKDLEPSNKNIYKVAQDILSHSDDDQSIENIMFLLGNEVVKTFYSFV